MVRCKCLKTDGKQCSRDASTKVGHNSIYCWQHQMCKKSIGEKIPIEKKHNQTIEKQAVVKPKLPYFKKPLGPKKALPTKKKKQIVEPQSTIEPTIKERSAIESEAKQPYLKMALEMAQQEGNSDLIEILTKAEQTDNVDAKNDNGYTGLMLAVMNGYTGIISALLKAGADPNVRDSNNSTALHRATAVRNPLIALLLLNKDYGADIDIKDKTGLTPLHKAIINHNPEVTNVCLLYTSDAADE